MSALTIRFPLRRRRPAAELRRPRVDDVVRGRDARPRFELRVSRGDFRRHLAPTLALAGLELVDFNPPAAGLEVALLFVNGTERRHRERLEALGVTVLASRELPSDAERAKFRADFEREYSR